MALISIRDRLGLLSKVHRSDSRGRGNLRRHKLRRNRRRSILEHLEDRRVLATYMVTSLADSGAGSLRDALQSANATGATDAIVFDEALAGTINLTVANGALQVTSPVSIQGPGSGIVTVDAMATSSDKFRVFEISDAANDVSITGLTLTGGMVDDGGGGILFRSADTLTLVDTVVTGNQASTGGGIYSEYEGSIVLQSSSVTGNTAESAKGGGIHAVDGDVTLTDSTISGNYSYSDGAGIFSQYAGNISITDSQVVNNKVTEAGYHGGGIYGANGDITITGSTISGNESKGDGGGVYSYKGSLTISNTTVTGNSADYGGGGVFNYEGDLTVTSSVFTNNNADYGGGGGIGNTAGRLTISGTRITDNQAVGDGGGVATNNGLVDISDSLIASNTATIDGGGIASAVGVVLVTNSTISGNTSTGRGGGIQADAAPVRLVHVTLAFNNTGGAGGGIGVVDDSTGESLLIYNSIVASNNATTGPDIYIPNDPGTALDIQSSLISNNTDSTLTASAGDASGNVIGSAASPVNPELSALANNGGATNTHDLSYFSPATDAANLALSLYFGADGNVGGGDDIALTTDQRSGLYGRNAIGLVAGPDMGALEKQQRPSLVVDTAADVVNGDLSPGDRSFREMLALANGDLGDDEISFSLTLPATISLDSALGSLVIGETLSIAGPGADRLTIENVSGQPFRIFDIQGTTAEASFRGLTLSGGDAGIATGGAIRSEAAQLHLFEVELLGNSAASGGGVAVNTGNLSIVSSTIAGNNASANGGGIAAFGAASSLVVLNSTVSGNTAVGDGGGVYSQNTPITLSNSTVAFNTAGTGGGVGLLADDNGESLSLKNAIVAANTATTAADFLAPLDVANDLEVVFSLVGDSDGTSLAASSFTGDQPLADPNGNLVGVDPGLEPLADQGGTTQTHALLVSSFAVDAGDRTLLPQDTYDVNVNNNFIEFLPVDQRGGPAERVVNEVLDMGSFELPPAAVIDWATPTPIVYGTLLTETQLDASANDGAQPNPGSVFGSFVYSPSAGTQLLAGDGQILSTTFTPNELREFRVTEASVSIDVGKADPIIDWSKPADIVYLTPLSAVQLDAVEQNGLPGSFAYDPAAGSILDAGTDQALSVLFTPADSDNYNSVSAGVLIDVLKATPTISWSNPADIPYGTTLSATQLNATADGNLPGNFDYSPAVGTLLDVGEDQTLNVVFTPTDDDNYNSVAASVVIDVVKADPVLSWAEPSDIVYGTPLSSTQLNATVSGGVSGDFVYTPDTGAILATGADQVLSVEFTPTGADAARYNQASKDTQITVVKADPSITWGDPAAIPHGTLLSGIQLNATADVAGVFSYSPDLGAQLGVGNGQTLNVIFTPDDDNYNTVGDSAAIDVLANQAPSFTASDPPAIAEDAGAQTVTGFISSFDAGAGESSLQSVLAYQVSSVGYPGMFVTLPSVTNAGVLTYEIAADVFGEATFELAVQDSGGTDGGGVDMSAVQTFTITVTGVNDSPSFSVGTPVEVLEDSGAQTVVGFASDFTPGQYEDGTWPGSQQLHDEGADGTADPLSTDNFNPTPLGSTQPGSNLVSGYVEDAFSAGDMDVFTFTVEPGFQWSGLYVDAYAYPNGANGDAGAFLAINTGSSFPYNAFDFQDPSLDYNAFIGGTVFGTTDLGGSNILPRAGNLVGSGFSGPLGAGVYTIYIQQTGPASSYTLDLEVTSVASQSLSSYEVSSVSLPSLFSAGPAIDANGDLTFTPTADTFGTSTFQVRVLDDGGTANGGVDASGFLTGTITVEEVVVNRDYGDAPALYAVLAADNGASHVVGSLTLGVAVDAEADGQPTSSADGDGSDDDGVVELASVIAVSDAATTSSFLVTASETGRVDAWIDFNENGVWSDVGEQIANNVVVGGGANTITYVVPAGTLAGDKVVRFRISSVGGLAPTGDAVDGEVEDMLLGVSDGAIPSAVTVDMNSAATSIDISTDVLTISDGVFDLFSAPLASIDTLTVNGRPGNDEVTLAFETGPTNGISLDGDGGDNSLVVSAASVDFTTSGSLVAVNFQSINANTATATQIVLDATSISAMSPSTKMIRVTGGEGDTVVLEDSGNWRMTSPLIDSGQFYRIALNQVSSEELQFDDPSSAWRNFLVPADVDASGTSTVLDALLIITELGANEYSDPVTSTLNDPLTVGEWPGRYFDVSRDGRITALDALQVLNFLAFIVSGEGEALVPPGDLSDTVEDLADDQRTAWLTWLPDRQKTGLMPGQRTDLVQQSAVQVQLPLENADNSSPELAAPQSLAKITSDLLSPESQLWADRVDQLLSEDFGLSESL